MIYYIVLYIIAEVCKTLCTYLKIKRLYLLNKKISNIHTLVIKTTQDHKYNINFRDIFFFFYAVLTLFPRRPITSVYFYSYKISL